jgi:hypothetical protein
MGDRASSSINSGRGNRRREPDSFYTPAFRFYLTVDPRVRRIVISKRIKEEFENARHSFNLRGHPLSGDAVGGLKPATRGSEDDPGSRAV